MIMTLFLAIWIVLGLTTLALALYRKFSSAGEEDIVHLGGGEEHYIPEQTALAKRLDAIDHWGKMLTVITVVLGLLLASVYLYQVWVRSALPQP
jgi:hypothetical protein